MKEGKTRNTKNYIRSERPNLFEPNVYISMVVKLSGAVTKEKLKSAVMLAYSKNETTMSKIVLEENGAAYYELLDQSGCKVFFEQRDWKEILKESEKQPFDLKNGELIRTYIITDKEELTLFILAHHLAGDGKSILVLVDDIMNALDGTALTYKPMVLIDQNYLKKRAKLPFLVNLFVNNRNRAWRKKGTAFTWEDYSAIHKKYWEKHSSEIEIKTYSAKELKADCAKGVTLNSYLTAKLLQEYPDSKVVGIPISIREHNNAMSNQTSGIAITYPYNPEQTFEENAAQVHNELHSKLENANIKLFVLLFIAKLAPTLIDSVLLYTHDCYENKLSRTMADIMGYVGKNGRDLGITNLMKIDIPCEHETYQITDILFIPPKVSYTKQVVGVATYGDNLNIAYHRMV